MWLLNTSTQRLEQFVGDDVPRYAILSHRWEDQEVSFKDINKDRSTDLKGRYKIEKCCQQASSDGLAYAWIDTCCIDKRSSAELSEAINSMYKWYRDSEVCYVYLSDVDSQNPRGSVLQSEIFTQSVWFTRGWTLQELLAPTQLRFFDATWQSLGFKTEHLAAIATQTGIPHKALDCFVSADYSIAERMSWAYNRTTTRVEDRAYSLLGLFDLNMPLLYGECEKAFFRFQQELLSVSADSSIFLFSGLASKWSGMLAASPNSFDSDYDLSLGQSMPVQEYQHDFSMTKQGLSGSFDLVHFALDIYAVRLGTERNQPMERLSPSIFVRWNFGTQRYDRVRLDDQNFILASAQPENESYIGNKTIVIGNSPLISVTSLHLTKARLNEYLFFQPTDSEIMTKHLFMLAGKYSRQTDLQVSMSPEVKFKARIHKQDIHPRTKTTFNEKGRECICLGDTNILRHGQGPSSSHEVPTAVLHLGRNHIHKPVLLLTLIKDPEVPYRQPRSIQRRECDDNGYLWFRDRPHEVQSSKAPDQQQSQKNGVDTVHTGAKPAVRSTVFSVGDLFAVRLWEDKLHEEIYGDIELLENSSKHPITSHLPTTWLTPLKDLTLSDVLK